jgi:hypothetical protein
MGKLRNAYNIVLVWKPGGKRAFGRQRHRWEGNAKISLGEVRYEDVG